MSIIYRIYVYIYNFFKAKSKLISNFYFYTVITDTFKFDEDTTLSGNLSYVNNIGGDVKFELINNPKNSKITLDNSGKYPIR